jgi:hypothetical protein
MNNNITENQLVNRSAQIYKKSRIKKGPEHGSDPFYSHLLFTAKRVGALGWVRTSDPLVRSQVLYPAELQVRVL